MLIVVIFGILLLLGSMLALGRLDAADPSPWLLYTGWFGAWGGLVLSFRAAGRIAGSAGPGTAGMLVVAALLRLVVLTGEPALSDDVYRYVWDGRVLLAGFDPYAHTPDDEALRDLRDPLWERTAHRDIETVYPPLAVASFTFAALFDRPILALRLLWLGVDLLTCWLLVRLLSGLGVASRAALLYAWNPLVVLEGVGMVHVDLLGVPFLLGALLVTLRDLREPAGRHRGQWLAGVLLAGGVLVKVAPVVLILPWLALLRSWRLACGFAVALAAGLSPLFLGVGVPPGLVRYGVSWEFNGLLFEPLWRLFAAVGVDGMLKTWTGEAERLLRVDLGGLYPILYPQFLAKVAVTAVLAAGLSIIAWRVHRRAAEPMRLVRVSLQALLLAMACSATLYPWYLLWIAPLVAVRIWWPGLVLAACAIFAYLPRTTGIEAFPWAWGLVWLPPLVAMAAGARDAVATEARP